MIEVSDIEGRKRFFAATAIAEVTEAAVSSQWHGIKSYIRTFDGHTVEARESADKIVKMIAEETFKGKKDD